MKKILTLALVVVMLLTFGIVASAEEAEAEATPVAKVGNVEYTTIDEAIANWTNGTTLTLLSDVTLSDVVKINSTESRYLNLGTFTLTAASGKNAIEIVCQNRGSAGNALTINADSENPGGINAGTKAFVYYRKTTSTKDRPIITINGGIFNGTISSYSPNRGTNTPQYTFNGGVFNKSISLGHSLARVFGGTFNASFSSTGDSSSYTQISGGKFKTLGFMTTGTGKLWFGTSKDNYNVGMYIDKDGYLVVGGAVITEPGDRFEAKITATKFSSYLTYSSAKANGLYCESAEYAIKKDQAGATVFVTEKTENVVDLTVDADFKGTVNVPANTNEFVVAYKQGTEPAWTVSSEDKSKVLVYTEIVLYALADDSNGVVVRNYVAYESLESAIDSSVAGDIIELNGDVTLNSSYEITSDKEITIDLKGHKLTAGADTVNLTISGKLTIIDTVGGGVSTMRNHIVCGELIVNGGTLQNIETLNAGFTVNINGGKLTLNGGTIQAVNDSNYAIATNFNNAGEIVINGGTVNGNFGCINIQDGTKLTINDGTFNVLKPIGGHCVYAVNTVATINGGTFNPYCVQGEQATSYSVYLNGASASVAIKGGTFGSNVLGNPVGAASGELTVTGGTFENAPADKFIANSYKTSENTNGTFTVEYWTVKADEIIEFYGYSVRENGTGLAVGYSFNYEAYVLYGEQNNTSFDFGAHFAVAGMNAIETSLVNYAEGTSIFNVVVKGLTSAHSALNLEMTLYVEVDGEKKFINYENGATTLDSVVNTVWNVGTCTGEVNA